MNAVIDIPSELLIDRSRVRERRRESGTLHQRPPVFVAGEETQSDRTVEPLVEGLPRVG